MQLKVAVVEDEPLAMRLIVHWLSELAEVELVGTADSYAEAATLLETAEIDAVFLDINLAGEDGFRLAHTVSGQRAFDVVFVSAYGDYALPAFRVDAVDFLKKPFTRAQLEESVKRARQRKSLRKSAVAAPIEARLLIRDGNRAQLVLVSDILWVESAGGYSVVHTRKSRHVTRASLGQLQKQLGPAFARIHRSVLLNGRSVCSVQSLAHGDARLTLDNGTELRMSRRYRSTLAHLGLL